MQFKQISAIFLLSFLIAISVTAQKQVNSPYARFNLGTLEPAASFKSLGMGGLGVGIKSGSSIFFANPASYSGIDTNSFIFDMGVDYGIVGLSDGTKHFKSDDMNFDHLIMGFPIAKGFGFSAGIVPVSSGYYKLQESVLKTDANYDPILGQYSSIHLGDGGLNNLFIGTGIKVTKNLSLGVNMTLLFGQLKRSYQVTFDDYSYVYNNSEVERIEMHGINLNYGLHYTANLKNDLFFTAGITYENSKKYKTSYIDLSYRYTAFGTRDTISYVSNDSSKTFIPGTFAAGFSFGKLNKLTAGFDFVYTRWSKSTIPGPRSYAADTKTFKFGLEYVPDRLSNYSLLKRLEYRIGGHTGNTYLVINGEQVNEIGASFGLGIPMRRSRSRTNLFIDFTRRSGSGLATKHIEDFYTMGASLNLWEIWFLKRKYD
jgi:hypothetical protein